ncbi:dipeptide epimerase [Gammaproteobacteria bacterium AB-CW1]|uniref:Dipeptide epimerase n=1 Tax=Natronospira elongata TaxID=3110268 RepID=A0AAP6JFG3_9GAMM|nr:dipeptide epimerase [Gammaproteobacteria bacterium AB-CW1]
MKIARVETWRREIALTRPYEIAFRRTDSVGNCFVRLIPDRGQPGLGCAAPEHHVTGETLDDCEAALDPAGLDWLVGQPVADLPRLLRELQGHFPDTPAQRAALDMALHDLLAQQLERPLVDVLGRAQHSLPTSITIGIMGVDETLDEAREYIDRGFRHLKVKTGQDLEEDIERIRALRTQLGDDIQIRVDPNQGYTAKALWEFVRDTKDYGLEFVEQPLPVSENMRSLSRTLRQRVAADESLLSPDDALNLAAAPPACGVFNIKLMKCGGLGPARRIADIAELAGVELMWGCMDESRISIAAALHAALACPATRYLDLDGHLDLAEDPAEGGFELKDGWLTPLSLPGLGVQLR